MSAMRTGELEALRELTAFLHARGRGAEAALDAARRAGAAQHRADRLSRPLVR